MNLPEVQRLYPVLFLAAMGACVQTAGQFTRLGTSFLMGKDLLLPFKTIPVSVWDEEEPSSVGANNTAFHRGHRRA